MSDSKEMDLVVRIRAKAGEALAGLKAVGDAVKKTADGFSTVGSATKSAFGIVGSASGMFLKPIEYMIKAGGLAAGTMLTMGAAALKAAADDQVLIERMEAAGFSADGARKEFEKLEKFSMNSAFKTDDLAEATIWLKQFGMEGDKTLGAIANAARFTGGSVADLAAQVGMMQAKGLKRFGIDIDSKDDKFVISWRSKLGIWQKDVTKNADEARRKLAGIMGQKFGTEISQPKGLSSAIEALKNSVGKVFGDIGEPMLAAAQRFVDWIRGGIAKLVESGSLQQIGAKIAEWMDKGYSGIKALIETLPEIWQNLKTLWTEAPGRIVELLATGIVGAGKILVGLIMAGFQASMSIWSAIGAILGSMFVDTLKDQLSATTFGSFMGLTASTESNKDRRDRQGRQMASAMSETSTGLGTAWEMAKAPMADLGKELNRQFKAATGMDVGATVTQRYNSNMQAISDEKNKAKYDLVERTISELVPRDGKKGVRDRITTTYQTLEAAGSISEGTKGNWERSVATRVIPRPAWQYSDWAASVESMGQPAVSAAGI